MFIRLALRPHIVCCTHVSCFNTTYILDTSQERVISQWEARSRSALCSWVTPSHHITFRQRLSVDILVVVPLTLVWPDLLASLAYYTCSCINTSFSSISQMQKYGVVNLWLLLWWLTQSADAYMAEINSTLLCCWNICLGGGKALLRLTVSASAASGIVRGSCFYFGLPQGLELDTRNVYLQW